MSVKRLIRSRGGERWPGRDIPVGHAAAPGWPGSFTGGTFTSTSPMASYAAGTSPAGIDSGTAGNPKIIAFVDFRATAGGQTIITSDGTSTGAALNYITFLGCRFSQEDLLANAFTNVDCQTHKSNNITFSYCTFCPSPALVPTAPTVWPGSSVGTGEIPQAGAFQSSYLPAYHLCPPRHLSIAAPPGGACTVDHCDFWGAGFFMSIGYVNNSNPAVPEPQTGTVTITYNWFHDHRRDCPPAWSSGTNYAVNDLVDCAKDDNTNPGQGFDLDVYRSITGGTNKALPSTSRVSNADWTYMGTHDHTDAILPGGIPGGCCIIRNNTFASIAPGQALAFQRGGGSRLLLAPDWGFTNSYSQRDQVVGVAPDEAGYQSITAGVGSNTGNNPTTDGGVHWANIGPAYYHDIQIINNYCTGYGVTAHLGPQMPNMLNFVFTDNVFTSDLLMTPIYGGGTGINYDTNFVAAKGCQWRRNIFRLYPGSGSGYASAQASWDGKFLIPDAAAGWTVSAGDWSS